MKRFAVWVTKCKRLISGSLTAKTFLVLLALLLIICLATYLFLGLFLPFANEQQSRRLLDEKSEGLIAELRGSTGPESGKLLLSFIRGTGAELQLLNETREPIDLFTFAPANDERMTGREYPFRFIGSAKEFILVVHYNPERAEEIARAISQSTLWVGGVILLLSVVSALLFSRYASRPIIRMSRIASHIAELDFSWYCPDLRDDEIGVLAKSLNELSDKLSAALSALRRRNLSLSYEVELEKERERRQLLFFSAVSHELKTPVSIALGQLEGMQAGIGVYKDREKYLGRCAEILRSLDSFIREMLSVSHMDVSGKKIEAPVNVSELLQSAIDECLPLAEPNAINVVCGIEPGIFILGDGALLRKALVNVVGNAAIYSPKDGQIEVSLIRKDEEVRLDITNSPAHIGAEHLPYLFDAFYRADQGGGVAGQGSGLGLYITRMILEGHGSPHGIENYRDGVRFSAVFQRHTNST